MRWRHILTLAVALSQFSAQAALRINEVMLNPPGPDEPNEYFELRGTPNALLPPGTYLIALEGDAGGNPGTIQNMFDLSGRRIGGNGFLVLVQNGHAYSVDPGAALLEHTGQSSGWGSGSSSTVGHTGESDQTSLENPSTTFFLITTEQTPKPGDDIDVDDNGVPDGSLFDSWTIHDSIGLLDSDGAGDIAYGAINFRRLSAPGNGATASGLIVDVTFTPDYVGRTGNTAGSTEADWVAGDDLLETARGRYFFDDADDTLPSNYAGAPLDHLGSPNFGAPPIPGVVTGPWNITTPESGFPLAYGLRLTVQPEGPVTIRIDAEPQLEVSVDGGASYHVTTNVVLSSIAPATLLVRVLDDNVADLSPHVRSVTHTIIATGDEAHYPLTTLVAPVEVSILENDWVLLNEVKINPPGEDAPFEFVELRSLAQTRLTNIYLVAVECEDGRDPGRTSWVLNLSGAQAGSNGLLFIGATNHPYLFPPQTGVFTDPSFSAPDGVIPDRSSTLLLLASPEAIPLDQDLDNGDNGTLERLPNGSTLLDTLTWANNDSNLVTYGNAVVRQNEGVADGATRFPGNFTPDDADAWFNGDLFGEEGASVDYNESIVGPDFPVGSPMSPGTPNNTAPLISPIDPFSGVIGDPTTPVLSFLVFDEETPPEGLAVAASSSNPEVVPNDRLTIRTLGEGIYTLQIDPVGVGYATLFITVDDGTSRWTVSFPYAASAPGRPETRWHTGVADTSSAWPINSDLMLVADDENQVIRIFRRHLSGPPVNSFNITPSLNLFDFENGMPREVDIEASTRVGNRMFWLGSHSHADNAEVRTNRATVFATDVAGSGIGTSLTFAGLYRHLKTDLVAWDLNNGHGKGANYYGLAESTAPGTNPKSTFGFNLEGLTMIQNSSSAAYIACRAPVVPVTNRQFGLLIPVLNFTNLAVSGAPAGNAQFGAPIELDLFGRGIRSIEADTQGYLILAGASGDIPSPYPRDFKLYTWSGNPTELPQEHAADLDGLNPEAIVELPPRPWTANTQIQLLSDNGRTVFYNDGIIGKRLPYPNFKKFRGDFVSLGAPVKPKPLILETRMEPGGVRVIWRARRGDTYRLQSKSSLPDPVWQDLPGQITASGPLAETIDATPVSNQRFYQVVVLP